MKTGTQKAISSLSLCVCVSPTPNISLFQSMVGRGEEFDNAATSTFLVTKWGSQIGPLYISAKSKCAVRQVWPLANSEPHSFFSLLEIGILIPFAVTAPPPPPPSVRERRGFSTNHKRRRRFHYALCPCHLLPLVRSVGGDFRFEKKGRKCFQTRRRLLCWVGLGRGRADILFYMSLAFCCTSSIMFPHQTIPSPPLFTP